MSDNDDEPKRERITMACTGVTELAKHKGLFPTFTRIVDGEMSQHKHEKRMCWGVKTMKATPGHVYTVESSAWSEESQVISPSTLRYEHQWHDRDQRLAWEAEARSLRTAADAAKAQKRAESESVLREQLAPLRKLYSNSLPEQRRALLANIINEITNPWRDER